MTEPFGWDRSPAWWARWRNRRLTAPLPYLPRHLDARYQAAADAAYWQSLKDVPGPGAMPQMSVDAWNELSDEQRAHMVNHWRAFAGFEGAEDVPGPGAMPNQTTPGPGHQHETYDVTEEV